MDLRGNEFVQAQHGDLNLPELGRGEGHMVLKFRVGKHEIVQCTGE